MANRVLPVLINGIIQPLPSGDTATDAGGNVLTVIPPIVNGRLTLETAVPISLSDQTAKTTLYFTPYNGNYVTTYSGLAWVNTTFSSEISIKSTDAQTGTTHNGTAVIDGLTDTSQLVVGMLVTGTNVGASAVIVTVDSATQVTVDVNSTGDGTNTITFKLPADKNFDVFVFSNSGTPKLEFSQAWTSDTARNQAIITQNGVDVKSGATTRLLIGTIRTTATAGQMEDSGYTTYPANRLVWNKYNQVKRTVTIIEATNSWTVVQNGSYQIGAWNGSNNNRFNLVQGDNLHPVYLIFAGVGSANGIVSAGIGLDVTNAISSNFFPANAETTSVSHAPITVYHQYTGLGFHFLQLIQVANISANTTFFGDNNIPTVQQSGANGYVMA